MACSKCKPVEDASIPELSLDYTTTTTRVMGRDGELYPVTRSLVPAGQRPRGGWGISVEIKGQIIAVKGESPQSVVSSVKKLLANNELRVSDLNLWLNLNIQWLSRINEKYTIVTLNTLLAITQ